MTPEAQRIAIAEWMGLIPSTSCVIPDYLNDLNAMHEAWLTLDANQRARFAEDLAFVCLHCFNNPKQEFVFSRCSLSLFANSKASERAEALLRTIGKWKET